MKKKAKLEIMLFNQSGFLYGIDTEMIARIYDNHQFNKGASENNRTADLTQQFTRVYEIHKLFKCSNPKENIYKNPKILLRSDVKGNDSMKPIAIKLDEPKDIIKIDLQQIRPIPELLKRSNIIRFFWAFALIENKIIVLLDLYKIPEET